MSGHNATIRSLLETTAPLLKQRRLIRSIAVAAMGAIFAGCATDGTAPAPISSEARVEALVAGMAAAPQALSTEATKVTTQQVRVLGRRFPLSRDVERSATIGWAGGTIVIAEAGVAFVVPSGALAQSTKITMRAIAGNAVAYEFEPHGLTFAVAPLIRQDLLATNWLQINRPFLQGGYFSDRMALDPLSGSASVQELIPAKATLDNFLLFRIWHFSGYLVSSN